MILSYQMHFPSLPETQEPTTTKNTAFLSFYEFFSTNLSPTKEVFVVQQKPYKKKKKLQIQCFAVQAFQGVSGLEQET